MIAALKRCVEKRASLELFLDALLWLALFTLATLFGLSCGFFLMVIGLE